MQRLVDLLLRLLGEAVITLSFTALIHEFDICELEVGEQVNDTDAVVLIIRNYEYLSYQFSITITISTTAHLN